MRHTCFTFIIALFVTASAAAQQSQPPAKPFEPVIGQAGKDVVWVPTPPELVEKMLDMAGVTAQDVVMDLGSGDGRNIIGAAKRGARAIGVEFNPDMVALSQRLAREAGVADKATFLQGDMYEADISKATVMALFLLPDNLTKLRDKFLRLKPGTRLVMNTFAIPEWDADVSETISGSCVSWCTSLLYFVPAKVAGTWKTPQGELTLTQTWPAAFEQLFVAAEKIGSMQMSSPQLDEQREANASGTPFLMATGGRINPGQSLTLTLTGLPHRSTTMRDVGVAAGVPILLGGLWAGIRVSPGRVGHAAELKKRKDKLFADLVSLEEQHSRGRLDEQRYLAKRETLIGQLERVMGELDRDPAGGAAAAS